MPYSVVFRSAARRELDKLPDDAFDGLDPKIRALATDPRPPGCDPYRGLRKHYRIRDGDYRAVYEVNDEERLVTVKAVFHRSNAYKAMGKKRGRR